MLWFVKKKRECLLSRSELSTLLCGGSDKHSSAVASLVEAAAKAANWRYTVDCSRPAATNNHAPCCPTPPLFHRSHALQPRLAAVYHVSRLSFACGQQLKQRESLAPRRCWCSMFSVSVSSALAAHGTRASTPARVRRAAAPPPLILI